MGKPDLFAKHTFADQTERLTAGAASWKEAPEIGLEKVQSDGILVVHDPVRLKELAPPWSLVAQVDEILIELKMQGDHVDSYAVSRTLLRRQAREVQRFEQAFKGRMSCPGRQPLWLVSAYLPDWARKQYTPEQLERGCYCWAKEHFTALWIAANELPLREELVPFLITRTGQPLREFVEWAIEKKAWPVVEGLVLSVRMLSQEFAQAARDFMKYKFPHLDEESKLNLESWVYALLDAHPEVREAFIKSAVEKAVETTALHTALHEARNAVVRILQLRKLEVRSEHLSRIEACMDLAKLHRWHDLAVMARSTDEALATE